MAEWPEPELVDEVRDWYLGLATGSKEHKAVSAAIDALWEGGPALGRPLVGEVVNVRIAHLKELRPLGTSIRILFTFDPTGVPILLHAGDKEGEWSRWYPRAIKAAAKRYEDYLRQGHSVGRS